MGTLGPGTRAAMFLMGAIWSVAGATWLFHLGPAYLFHKNASAQVLVLPTCLLFGGLLLLKNGIKPDRPKTFEDEIPDAHPNLDNDYWPDPD